MLSQHHVLLNMPTVIEFQAEGLSIIRKYTVCLRYLGGVIDIADPVTGTLIFIKLGYLKNFMSNKCSMKCLWASENQRNWIFDIIY